MTTVALDSLLAFLAQRKICHSVDETVVVRLLSLLLRSDGTVLELCLLTAQRMLKV